MIGSREWMNINAGNLTFIEKIKFINQIIFPISLSYAKSKVKASAPSSLDIKTVQLPDSNIIKNAIATLEHTQNTAIINHSWRCLFWSIAIAAHKNCKYDIEELALACLLHDIALVDHKDEFSGCQCFTYESALRAEQLCEKHQYNEIKTANISNAICLHMNGILNEKDSNLTKEVLLLQKATSCDVIGTDLNLIGQNFQNQLLKQYPRENFNSQFKQLMQHEITKHPNSRAAVLQKLGMNIMISFSFFKE
ncbi:HD domain-containing protein [Acinetobacter gerneri]|uniref:HD domain-containing protein n=1 Tax=Acinetobacter gerneri TaxID=202952 RepID=UPI0029356F90|nr:HD domain-containing protein [Acinetobacter gerneri]MDV2439052.1 HD domain-containing protein [Acinetobacter gerneri]